MSSLFIALKILPDLNLEIVERTLRSPLETCENPIIKGECITKPVQVLKNNVKFRGDIRCTPGLQRNDNNIKHTTTPGVECLKQLLVGLCCLKEH